MELDSQCCVKSEELEHLECLIVMVQWLKVVAALPEHPALVPSTCTRWLTTVWNASFREMPSTGLLWHQHVMTRYIYRSNTHTSKLK